MKCQLRGKCDMSGVATTRHARGSLLRSGAATFAEMSHITQSPIFVFIVFFFYPGQTKCWKILYLSWCQDFKKVSLYFLVRVCVFRI